MERSAGSRRTALVPNPLGLADDADAGTPYGVDCERDGLSGTVVRSTVTSTPALGLAVTAVRGFIDKARATPPDEAVRDSASTVSGTARDNAARRDQRSAHAPL